MIPLIPLLCIAAIAGGAYGLHWYHRLSEAERQAADSIACDYAAEFYQKALSELTPAEARHVADLTKRHFLN